MALACHGASATGGTELEKNWKSYEQTTLGCGNERSELENQINSLLVDQGTGAGFTEKEAYLKALAFFDKISSGREAALKSFRRDLLAPQCSSGMTYYEKATSCRSFPLGNLMAQFSQSPKSLKLEAKEKSELTKIFKKFFTAPQHDALFASELLFKLSLLERAHTDGLLPLEATTLKAVQKERGEILRFFKKRMARKKKSMACKDVQTELQMVETKNEWLRKLL